MIFCAHCYQKDLRTLGCFSQQVLMWHGSFQTKSKAEKATPSKPRAMGNFSFPPCQTQPVNSEFCTHAWSFICKLVNFIWSRSGLLLNHLTVRAKNQVHFLPNCSITSHHENRTSISQAWPSPTLSHFSRQQTFTLSPTLQFYHLTVRSLSTLNLSLGFPTHGWHTTNCSAVFHETLYSLYLKLEFRFTHVSVLCWMSPNQTLILWITLTCSSS